MSLLLLIAAVVCFVVALLLSLAVFQGAYVPWMLGGLMALALSMLPLPAFARA